MRHKHHIIPKHRGGSNEPSNLVEVTPTQHAMFHYCEWKLWGDYKDFCAYKMILGDVKNPEFRSARAKAFSHKLVEAARKAGIYDPEVSKERAMKGNKSQREKFEKEGRTIAEKKWIVTTPEGETLEVSNLKKFCRENNLLPNKMCEVSKGKWKQHRGYTCKRFE
jgi:hypothetical protein